MPSSSRRAAGIWRRAPIVLVAAGIAIALGALLKDVLGRGPVDFGLEESLVVLTGLVLVLEGALQLATPRRPALWATLTEPGIRGTFITAILAAALMDVHLYAFRDYFVDDSYITFRFARNLATGHGVVWNVGEPPVEGYSNFLWLLLSAAALRAHLDPLASMRVVAIGCYFASALALYGLVLGLTAAPARRAKPAGAEAEGASPSVAPRLAVLLFAAIPSFAFWTMSGLETSSVVLLTLLYFAAFAREFGSGGWPWRTAVCAVLLSLSRPESLLVILLSLGPVLLPPDSDRLRWLRRLGAMVLPAVAIYWLWKWRTFGTLMPNTAWAKALPLAGHVITIDFFVFIFPFLLAWLTTRARRVATLTERQILWVVGGFLLAAVNVTSQVAHYYRFFLPVLAPLLALPALAGEALAVEPEVGRRAPAWGATAAALTLLYALAPSLAMKVYADREVDGYRSAHERVGALLQRRYPPTAVLAASDCGLIPYISGMKTIDIWGLTDRRIATRGFSVSYALEQRPEAIVLHSDHPQHFVGRDPYDVELYSALEDDPQYVTAGEWEFYGYWLWLFVRVDSKRGASHARTPRAPAAAPAGPGQR